MWLPAEFDHIGPGDIYCHDPGWDEGWLCITKIDDTLICLPLGDRWERTSFTGDTDDIHIWTGEGLPNA